MNAWLAFAGGAVVGAIVAVHYINWRTAHALRVLVATVEVHARLLEADLSRVERYNEERSWPSLPN